MTKVIEIKLGGFGGQGIILAGIITGKAAAIFDDKYSCLIKSYGPEARGSSCNVQVIISDARILYPYVINPDILVLLSQEAYNRFAPSLKPNGLLLYDKDLVDLHPAPQTEHAFAAPAMHFAEQLGKKVVTNIIMLGFFTSMAGVVSREAMGKAIEETVPSGTLTLNMKAYEQGYDYGLTLLEKHPDFVPPGKVLA